MNDIRFTIITVCYNAEKWIEMTILSLLRQKYTNYEYIIKDGQSSDHTLEIVHRLTDENEKVQVYSGKDQGIYDAMNQAVLKAKGEYIYFLNAGDCFCDSEVLERTDRFIAANSADVVYGDIIQNNDDREERRKHGRICGNKGYFLIGSAICHQALFAKRILFDSKMFDIKYKVCADREWQMFQMSCGSSFAPMFFDVADVLVEGFSKSHVDVLEQETIRCLEHYYKNWSWIYKLILTIKKNIVVANMLRRIEKGIFVRKLK